MTALGDCCCLIYSRFQGVVTYDSRCCSFDCCSCGDSVIRSHDLGDVVGDYDSHPVGIC